MCNREAASVEAEAQKWAGKVDFIGVAWTGSDAAFQKFIDKYSLTFPTISDDPGTIFARFGVPSQPAFVVIGADGQGQQMFGAVEPAVLDSVLTGVTSG